MNNNLNQNEGLPSLSPFTSPHYASFSVRFFAWILDTMVILPIAIFVIFLTAFLYKISPTNIAIIRSIILIIPILSPIYNIVLLRLSGATFGKRLLRLKVVSQTDNQLTLGQIIIRETLGKLISAFFFDLGYLWIIIDHKKQSWHDKISKTYVIKDLTILSIKKDIIRYIGIFLFYGFVIIVSVAIFIYRIYHQSFPCGRQPKEYTNFEEAVKEPKKVCLLHLSSQHLTRIPPEIVKLTNLRYLNLSNNEITELSPEIGELRQLLSFSLFKNKITYLPPEIGELTNLEHLDLAYNQLTSLPTEIGKLSNLKTLDLHGNRLGEISGVQFLNNLVFLILDDNSLSQEEVDRLKQLLPKTSISFRQISPTATPPLQPSAEPFQF